MIVVTAMPVANAKARAIITKIVFMTRSLSVPTPKHGRTGQPFCDGHHGSGFLRCVRARQLARPASALMFRFKAADTEGLERGQNPTRAGAAGLVVCPWCRRQSRYLVTFDPMWASATMAAELERARSNNLRVLRNAGMRDLELMRDLFGINGTWIEECRDVYECCAFADCCRDSRADTVRLHSHPVVAQTTA